MFRSIQKVLIIDDEADIAQMVSDRLTAAGYAVLTADTGASGLEKAFKEKPNLILLDITMPNMDGWSVLRMLRENDQTKKVPVIMLTAQGETSSHFKAQSLDATDYFVKPFEGKELLTFVEKYI